MAAYATVAEANAYFDSRLYSSLWGNSTVPDREIALAQATRIIDRLNFAGERHAAHLVRFALTGSNDFEISLSPEQHLAILDAALTQELEFPRGDDTEVPDEVKFATMEVAFALLDGVNTEMEFANRGVVSQGYSSVRVSYDRGIIDEAILAGIPSTLAWNYLKPYLRGGRGIKISKV